MISSRGITNVLVHWPLTPTTLYRNERYVRVWHTYIDSVSGYSALVDLILALLRITIIWKLQLRRAKKIALCAILGLGVV